MSDLVPDLNFAALREFVRDSAELIHGFSRPNWRMIDARICKSHGEHLAAAWNEASLAWVQCLATDLSGGYAVAACGRFLLLSDLPTEIADGFVRFAQSSANKIISLLGDAAWKPESGRHVVLLFSEEDDYYEYISYFYPEGAHPTSSGICFHRGYVHIALRKWDQRETADTLVHELAHLFVAHLHLPRWINEAWAMAVQREIFSRSLRLLDRDWVDDLWEFWTEDRIQAFWAGTSFGMPGKYCTFSYQLSELLLNSAMQDLPAFRHFLIKADYRDAGQDAALQYLGVSLGDIAEQFLGEGNWRPNRKKIAELLHPPVLN